MIDALICYAAGLVAFGLGLIAYFREKRSFVHRTFALGMWALALEQVFRGASLVSLEPMQVLNWQRFSLIAGSFVPGLWLIFSISFGRAAYSSKLRRFKWLIAAVFVAPLSLTVFAFPSFYSGPPTPNQPLGWLFHLNWAGQIHCVLLVFFATLIVANVEATLLSSIGRARWQVKFMVLGIIAFFAGRIYSGSHELLFATLDTQVDLVKSFALLLSCLLMFISMRRAGLLQLDVYVSHGLLYRSITLLAVGVYLLAVAFLSKALHYFDAASFLNLDAVLILAALIALLVAAFSDRLRQDLRSWISRHLKRPHYDYKKIWREFTLKTGSEVNRKQYCRLVVKTVSETFEALSVTVWLVEGKPASVLFGASTALSADQGKGVVDQTAATDAFLAALLECENPVDVESRGGPFDEVAQISPGFFSEAHIRYCFPLRSQSVVVGVLTLSDRVRRRELSVEDYDLLQVIGDQIAANLHNLKMSARLRQSKELEIFQNMSAFFVHDLKNLASRLSLTVQNFPRHFQNPEFREDALGVMSESVEKIRGVCGRLAALKKGVALKRLEVDLNQLVGKVITDLDGNLRISPQQDLTAPLPRVGGDPDQLEVVLVNLLLNANEATGSEGAIRVETFHKSGSVIVQVSDTGCGMSEGFLEESLFHPFQTTKKEGMGIGLYQSKFIIEAHQGRIEVESEEGQGSTFRILLPAVSEGASAQ